MVTGVLIQTWELASLGPLIIGGLRAQLSLLERSLPEEGWGHI